MPTTKSQAVYKDTQGGITADKINITDTSSPNGAFIQLEVRADGNLYFQKNGLSYVLASTVLPSTGGSGGGTPPAPTVPPTTVPATSLPQNGNELANGDGTSLTTPFPTVTTTTQGASTASLNAGKYEYNIVNTGYFELGQTFDGTGNLARKLRFSLKVDTAAVITNESNLIVIKNKVNGVAKDFLFIKLFTDYTLGTTKYNLVIRFAETGDLYVNNYQGLYKRIYKAFTKGTEYNFEVYVDDSKISLAQILSGTFPTENIDVLTLWYNDPDTGHYGPFDLTGRNFDSIHFGEFYSNGSGNFTGKYQLDNLVINQKYIAPTVPDDVGKIAEAWKGWKNRYLKPNGMVIKDDGKILNDTPQVERPNVVSEAQAYGMMISAQLGDKTTFDLIHNFNQTVLRRSLTGETVGGSFIAYLYDPYKLTVKDNAGAPDADVDAALGLIWAHERWGSAGTYNYQAKALEVLADLKQYSSITYKGKKIIDGGTWNYDKGISREINPSYLSPGSFKKFKDFTGDTFWDLARDGTYLLWKDSGDATLRGKVGAGVIPNWVHVNNDVLSDPISPDYSIDHSYDAFRCEHRGYWDHIWNPGTSGFATFAAYKLKQIYETEYANTGFVYAERAHNNVLGTNLYENLIFTTKHWMTLNAAGSSVAPAFKAAKLNPANLYKYHPTGSFYDSPGYFGESWNIIYFMTQNNLWRYNNT